MKHRMIINLCKQEPFKSVGGKESHGWNRNVSHEPFNPVNLTRRSVNLARSMGVRAAPLSSLHVAMFMYYARQWCVH